MVDDLSPQRPPGRQRRYASNAERQAAYRARARARQAAVVAAAGGDRSVAEDFVESIVRAKVAGLEADRARFKKDRDRAEHELALARPRLERAAILLTETRGERDGARRASTAARAALRLAKAEAEREIRRLNGKVSDLQREVDSARRVNVPIPGVVARATNDSVTGAETNDQASPDTATLNRAQRRALLRRKSAPPPRSR